MKRCVTHLASAGALLASLLAAPAAVSAQPALPESSSRMLDEAGAAAREGAWEARNQLHDRSEELPPELAGSSRDGVDAVVEGLFPGLIEERALPPAPEPAPFDRGSCPPAARACVDLDGRRSWLQEGGEVSYGPVPISIGRIGHETPRGTHHVNRKVIDEVSYIYDLAPMPYSVYFTHNGHAFHEGDLSTSSAGCIRLSHNDAVTYFNELQIGDMVHVY